MIDFIIVDDRLRSKVVDKRLYRGVNVGTDFLVAVELRLYASVGDTMRKCYLYDSKEYECGLRMDKLSGKCLLYTDDQVILALSVCGLQDKSCKIMILLRKGI
ncbi:hypothetical protein EVAR_45489_1 [Eumeta japonica]|uniref:Uncharacterized protein n=1 Tax=Eumeta variegata TaxID=151549 RepID=A0A4C1WEL3_EUMVA|nr:hypothetical protein EVAR_45489_1 [Eumeta japonica]